MPDPVPDVVVYGIYLYLALVCTVGLSMQAWIHRNRLRLRSTADESGPDASGTGE